MSKANKKKYILKISFLFCKKDYFLSFKVIKSIIKCLNLVIIVNESYKDLFLD